MTTAARKSTAKAFGDTKPFTLTAIALTKTSGGDVVVPDWVKLFGVGHLTTNDGREWFNTKPDDFIAATTALNLDPPVDTNHNIEHGLDDPAMGWVKRLENREGEIWAEIEWTKRGHTAVANKDYRYVSPSFAYDERTLQIRHLESVALVNKPAFSLPALTSRKPKAAQTALTSKTETSMFTEEQLAQMRKTYGLADDADAEAIMAAIAEAQKSDPKPVDQTDEEKAAAKAAEEAAAKQAEEDAAKAAADSGAKAADGFTAENPDPSKWVPASDYQAVVGKLGVAESGDDAPADVKDIEAALDKAVASGRIAPGNKAYHRANCATQGGLNRFQGMVKTSAEIVPTKPAIATTSKELGGTALTAAQKKVCTQTGVSEADYAKTLASQNS